MSGNVGHEAPWSRHAARDRFLWIGAVWAAAATALQLAAASVLSAATAPRVYRDSLPGALLTVSFGLTAGCLLTILHAMQHADGDSESSAANGELNGGVA